MENMDGYQYLNIFQLSWFMKHIVFKWVNLVKYIGRGCKWHSFRNIPKMPFVRHIWDLLWVCGDSMWKRCYRALLVKDGLIFIFWTHKGETRPRCNNSIIMLVGDLFPLNPKDHGVLGHANHPHVWVIITEIFSSMMQFSSEPSYIIYYMFSFSFHLFSNVI